MYTKELILLINKLNIMLKKFSSAALAVALLLAPCNAKNAQAEVKHNGVALLALNGGFTGSYLTTTGSHTAQYNTTINGGMGFTAGVGYQMVVPMQSGVNFYTGLDFTYDFLGNISTLVNGVHDHTNNMISNLFGGKLRLGFSMNEDKTKGYFTFGAMGFNAVTIPDAGSTSISSITFVPTGGIGMSQEVVKGKLALFLEVEGGPFIDHNASVVSAVKDGGIMLARFGMKAQF